MKSRLKLKTTAPATREEMETLIGEIARWKNEERRIKAEMDAQLQAVRTTYEDALSVTNDQLALRLPRALAWCEAHPEAFGTARSITMLHGTVGWRVNPPSLKPRSGFTWEKVLAAIKAIPGFHGFIRTKEEVDKQAILARRDDLFDADLRTMGLKVIQEDEFYVEPTLTETDTREKASP